MLLFELPLLASLLEVRVQPLVEQPFIRSEAIWDILICRLSLCGLVCLILVGVEGDAVHEE
ncbi:Uncharacterised protein [Mycobacteroides abscessus]|nr:Uncharacterised protein [Mycobacteroides abscessus]